MTAPKQATPDHPIHELIANRWSPYAFSDRPVSEDDLRSLFEAARWAASSPNCCVMGHRSLKPDSWLDTRT